MEPAKDDSAWLDDENAAPPPFFSQQLPTFVEQLSPDKVATTKAKEQELDVGAYYEDRASFIRATEDYGFKLNKEFLCDRTVSGSKQAPFARRACRKTR